MSLNHSVPLKCSRMHFMYFILLECYIINTTDQILAVGRVCWWSIYFDSLQFSLKDTDICNLSSMLLLWSWNKIWFPLPKTTTPVPMLSYWNLITSPDLKNQAKKAEVVRYEAAHCSPNCLTFWWFSGEFVCICMVLAMVSHGQDGTLNISDVR